MLDAIFYSNARPSTFFRLPIGLVASPGAALRGRWGKCDVPGDRGDRNSNSKSRILTDASADSAVGLVLLFAKGKVFRTFWSTNETVFTVSEGSLQ